MKKHNLLLLLAMACFAGKSMAQEPCASTHMYNMYKQQHPEIATYEQQLTDETNRYYLKANKLDLNNFAAFRTTSEDTVYYNIPVVIHVMHNYGPELSYLNDNFIYATVALLNKVYSLQQDTSTVIPPFKQYVGKTNIRFHLATIDPNGNPTKGILHHATYLTYGGDDQVKMDLWSPENYYNIWFENYIGESSEPGSVILAYANFPSSAAAYPLNDGVIARYNCDSYLPYTIEHETGHYFNLLHPWNNNGTGMGAINMGCGDDDVDDTPPTTGHFSICPLYDTICDQNYFKTYPRASGVGDSLVNYPDTANVQNIMDYSSCTNMFTKGQVQRMYATLNSNIGYRDSLWSPNNMSITGALNPLPDLPPVTDFYVQDNNNLHAYFTFPGVALTFYSACWGDTVTGVTWNFPTTSATPVHTSTEPATSANNVTSSISNSFTDPGWVSLTVAATGNNSGTTTTTYPRAVFVANTSGVDATSYFEGFNNSDTAQWPTFNYYNNEFYWQLANVGYGDNSSMEYLGYDSRIVTNPTAGIYLYPATGTPKGDYDDLFSIPVKLDNAEFAGSCSLNYFFSGASRSANSLDLNDTLEIDYSINKSLTWTNLAKLTKTQIDNKGAVSTPYVPTSTSDWEQMSLNIPSAARTSYTVFRFRYRPSVAVGGAGTVASGIYSSGNNFYMDNVFFSPFPAGVSNVKLTGMDVAVAPNPTNGDAYVIIKDAANGVADIVVTDITGKLVYKTSQQLTGNETHILIPHSAIGVSGMYLVQATTGNQTQTRKLVVE